MDAIGFLDRCFDRKYVAYVANIRKYARFKMRHGIWGGIRFICLMNILLQRERERERKGRERRESIATEDSTDASLPSDVGLGCSSQVHVCKHIGSKHWYAFIVRTVSQQ